MIENKTYGEIKYLKLYRNVLKKVNEENNWFGCNDLSGGVVFDLHIHDIDLLTYIFGKPIKTFSIGDLSHCITLFDYNQCVVSAESNWFKYNTINFSAGFIAEFDRASLILENDKLLLVESENKCIDVSPINKDYIFNQNNNWLQMYYSEIKYFKECIKNNVQPEITNLETSSISVEVTRQIYDCLLNENRSVGGGYGEGN